MSLVNILILEDDIERQRQFKMNFKNCNITFTDNANDAISELSQNEFEYLLLDHDLGCKSNGTGFDVAKWLFNNDFKKPKFIYIHSANPVGSKNMQNYLPKAVLAPMIWQKIITFNKKEK